MTCGSTFIQLIDQGQDDQQISRFHRSIARPAFVRDRVSDFELFDRHAAIAISQLKQRLRQGCAVNFEVSIPFGRGTQN